MEEYLEFLSAVVQTALAVAVVGVVVAGLYTLYKTIKD